MVQFMEKDNPNLKHPYAWYKYGEFRPYSWRGVVLGEPIRGRFSDKNVTLIGEVRDQEEWEKIEPFEMSQDFGQRLESMDKNCWIRVWRVSNLPWEQWTLVSEVVVEAAKKRLDKAAGDGWQPGRGCQKIGRQVVVGSRRGAAGR
ncbi:hypothetical protein L1987_29944 [Smallanthus sonchifolius]|uniref:Uncharacterized protein n=1 Tax=Smallanthus sonchifolius TaxID=185202 RepID=A0ACB9I227_9ASTR|nr:hypothetical protein L1987_29944 [Smallanthus sonchifolius]